MDPGYPLAFLEGLLGSLFPFPGFPLEPLSIHQTSLPYSLQKKQNLHAPAGPVRAGRPDERMPPAILEDISEIVVYPETLLAIIVHFTKTKKRNNDLARECLGIVAVALKSTKWGIDNQICR